MSDASRWPCAVTSAGLVLVSAPLCAIADGLGPHGGFERDAPEHVKAFRRAAGPLLDWSDWESVYHFWEIPLGGALLLVLASAWRRVRGLPAGAARAATLVAWGAAAAFACSAMLEGLSPGDLLTNVGVGGTFLSAPVALLAAPVAGVLGLWRRVLPHAMGALVVVPPLVALVVLVVPHIPGAPAVALALAWGAFAAWRAPQESSRARMASA